VTPKRGFVNRPYAVFALAVFLLSACASKCALASETTIRYEYKVLSLGSLSALQKDSAAGAKLSEMEAVLNESGSDGWEMVSIFAVRTTFDPNVFFAVLKRQIPDTKKEGENP
jgi:hypothetical protein